MASIISSGHLVAKAKARPSNFSEMRMEGAVFCRFERGQDEMSVIPGAHVAQLVEHILGKDEVISSILIMGSSFDVK